MKIFIVHDSELGNGRKLAEHLGEVFRAGGADGRYVMESTSVLDTMAEQCAKATRGLVMLDNAAWVQCGGKPQGAASTSASLATGHEHAGHTMP